MSKLCQHNWEKCNLIEVTGSVRSDGMSMQAQYMADKEVWCCEVCGEMRSKKPEREEPKQDCDHIVGFGYFDGRDGEPVKESETENPWYDSLRKSNYCPECGEKLNLSQDE